MPYIITMSADQQNLSSASKPSLEWMYKPSALVNREDYLLGRTVDKSLKILEEAEKGNAFNYADEVEKDLTPLSIFASQGSGPIDVIKKIKDDPLYQIQKQEEESLKQLLKNPVRMKELKRRVKERQVQAKKKKSKKGKKDKKKRRRRTHSSDSSSTTSSSSSSSSSDSDSDNTDTPNVKAFKDIDKLLSAKLQSLKNSTSSSKSKKRSRNHDSHSNSDKEKRRRMDDHRPLDYNDRHRPIDDSHRNRRYENPTSHHRHEQPDHSSGNYYGRSTSTTSSSKPRQEEQKRISRALTEDDLEKKRKEMMENAKWRDEQRTNSVNKYRNEETKEKEELEKKRDPDFIRKQLNAAASSGSVEKRIKSNSYNIQKSKSSMNENFMKR